MAEAGELSKRVAAAPTVDERARIAEQVLAEHWSSLDVNATTWDRIVYAQGIDAITLSFMEFPRDYGTHSGAVEQWLALAHVLKGNLALLEEGRFHGCGWLFTRKDARDDELVLAVTDGPPIIAAGPLKDVYPPHAMEQPDMAKYADTRVLTVAGVAVLAWVGLHERLRKMLDSISPRERLGMVASIEMMETRTAALAFKDSDLDLMRRVGRELIAMAPAWRAAKEETPRAVAPPSEFPGRTDLEYPLDSDQEKVLEYMWTQRGRVLKVTQIAGSGGLIRDRERIGEMCVELGNARYLSRKSRKAGWSITDLGIQRAVSNHHRD